LVKYKIAILQSMILSINTNTVVQYTSKDNMAANAAICTTYRHQI